MFVSEESKLLPSHQKNQRLRTESIGKAILSPRRESEISNEYLLPTNTNNDDEQIYKNLIGEVYLDNRYSIATTPSKKIHQVWIDALNKTTQPNKDVTTVPEPDSSIVCTLEPRIDDTIETNISKEQNKKSPKMFRKIIRRMSDISLKRPNINIRKREFKNVKIISKEMKGGIYARISKNHPWK